jgi:hypothetical protein
LRFAVKCYKLPNLHQRQPSWSRARGTATQESDFDLLVVEKDPAAKREEMERLRQAVSDHHRLVDIWVMGEEEFEETKDVIGGLAYPVHQYGLVLYENT